MASVLIVEDDPAIAGLVQRALASSGYSVQVESDGEAGLARCVELVPDVLVLDVNLPRMDGYQVAKHLKQDGRVKHIPILFLTAQDRPKDIIAGIQAGARHYLTKPFKLEDLVGKIKKLIP